MSDKKPLEDLDFLAKLIVAIGEVSEISGVPTRQIRYWEEKGYVASCTDGDGKTRRYDYYQIKKIFLIKKLLDEGFTLEVAAKKTEARLEHFNNLFQKLKGA